MTLKELFKKHNAKPGFKFKSVRGDRVFEVLCIGVESVFAKNISDIGEESSFDLDMKGYEKYEESKKTKKIHVVEVSKLSSLEEQASMLEIHLKLISQMNSPMGFAGCPTIARQALEEYEAWKSQNGS